MKIIMYHYINQSGTPIHRYGLTLEQFKAQVNHFLLNGGIVNANEFQESYLQGRPISGEYLLTFDDGLREHSEEVLGYLEKMGVCAYFFINGQPLIEERMLNVHRIHLLTELMSPEEMLKFVSEKLDSFGTESIWVKDVGVLYSNQSDSVQVKIKKLLNYQVKIEYSDLILDELMQKYSDEKQWHKYWYMDRKTIKRLSESQVIGLHTFSHPVMSMLSESHQRQEISTNCDILKELTGYHATSYCHPYGVAQSYNESVLKILGDMSIQIAFSYDEQDFNPKNRRDKYTVSRRDCKYFC